MHNALVNTDFSSRLELQKNFIRRVLKWNDGARGVITNGRVIGPLNADEHLTGDDFALLDVFSFNSYSEKVVAVFKNAKNKGKLKKL